MVIVIVFFPVPAFSSSLNACYDVKAFYIKVGESCITYSETRDNKISVRSFMRTVDIGSIAKRVEDHGEAFAEKDGMRPVSFKFYQEEGRFKRFQEYLYEKDIIRVRETRYKGLSNVIQKDEKKTYPFKGEVDPYIAALLLFKEVGQKKEGILKMFYDDRFYNIPYKVLREEKITVGEEKFNTYYVLVKPNIAGKGLLKPKGDWYMWIDKKSKLPVKMSVGFIIGSVKLYLTSMEGNRNLLNQF